MVPRYASDHAKANRLPLMPLSQDELAATGPADFPERLFAADSFVEAEHDRQLIVRVLIVGFPDAIARTSPPSSFQQSCPDSCSLSPRWSNNTVKRLVKASQLHFVDTGLADQLVNFTADRLTPEKGPFGPSLRALSLANSTSRTAGARAASAST